VLLGDKDTVLSKARCDWEDIGQDSQCPYSRICIKDTNLSTEMFDSVRIFSNE
jgi:hypothetical protein